MEPSGIPPKNSNDQWYRPFFDLRRGAAALAAHTAMLILVLGAFRGVQKALEWYWGGMEVLLFGKLPVRYVFDGADLLMLLGFLTVGLFFVLKAYMGR